MDLIYPNCQVILKARPLVIGPYYWRRILYKRKDEYLKYVSDGIRKRKVAGLIIPCIIRKFEETIEANRPY